MASIPISFLTDLKKKGLWQANLFSHPMDPHSLESLPNIGKVIAGNLRSIGIQTKEEFLARDPYEVFHELTQKVDPTLCRCALASIIGAYEGIVWHKITKHAAKEYDEQYPKHRWKNRC